MKFDRYCHEQLAFTGLALLGGGMPRELRPDLWATGVIAFADEAAFLKRAERFLLECRAKHFFAVDLAGVAGPVKVAAKTDARLAERIAEITGRTVSNLRPLVTLHEVPPPAKVLPIPEDIPSYPCQARTDALEALGIPETKFHRRGAA